MVDFDQLIEDLMKRSTAKVISIPIFQVREDHRSPITVSCHDELVQELVTYINKLQKAFFNNDVEMPFDMAYSLVLRLLRIENLVPVYDQCVHATDGGLPKVIDRITEVYHDQAVEKYVNYKLDTALSHPLAADEIEEILTVFVRKIGRHLGIDLSSLKNMSHRWKDIIRQHALALSSYQAQIGAF